MAGSVVVGVDGSDSSLRAVRWAAEEAVRRRLPLRIVHGLELGLSTSNFPSTGRGDPKREAEANEMISNAADLAHEAAAGVGADTAAFEVRVEIRRWQAGAYALLSRADSAELLVVGSRGRGGFRSLLLGSTAFELAQHAPVPVVVVRNVPDGAAEGADGPIVVGIDGSELSRKALRFGFESAVSRGVGLTAVPAWEAPWVPTITGGFPTAGPEAADAARQRATHVVSDVLAPLRQEFPDVTVLEQLVEGGPAKVLVDAAADSALVVVGSRGRGGFAALLLGSVSQAVLQHATAPVAVVRPPTRPEL